jgi:hypothetical protein
MMMQLVSSAGFGLLVLSISTSATQRSNGNLTCWNNQADSLSPKAMKSLLRRLDALKPPALGKNVRISGRMELEVNLNATGKVLCVRARSGNPLIIGSAIEAVSHSEFASFRRSESSEMCGVLILRYRATEHAVTISVEEK